MFEKYLTLALRLSVAMLKSGGGTMLYFAQKANYSYKKGKEKYYEKINVYRL